MSNLQDIEELIADSMTGLMTRAERLDEFDQLAISEEFREWLNEGVRLEDVLKLFPIKQTSLPYLIFFFVELFVRTIRPF